MEITEFTCHRCGKHIVFEVTGVAKGYGLDEDDNQLCYACCAEIDKETMIEEEWFVLYLVEKNVKGRPVYQLTNWPGSLVIEIDEMKTGSHYRAGVRRDVWFTFNGKSGGAPSMAITLS